MDVALGAVQIGGVAPGCLGEGFAFLTGHIHIHLPLPDFQRRLQRLDHARLPDGGKTQPVLHHLQLAVAARVDAGITLTLQQLLDLGFGEILRHRHRESDDQARVARVYRARGQCGMDRLRRVARHLFAAAAAIECRRAREHQFHVIVQLGHGADGRARGAHRVGLVDGDGGRDALDGIHLRLVHAVEELPRVGTEGLYVAALALGVQCVEDERGLARARDAGDDHQLAIRDREREILEVVLPGAADVDRVRRRCFLLHSRIIPVQAAGSPRIA